MKNIINTTLALALFAFFGISSASADGSGIEIKMIAEKEIEVLNKDGTKVIKRIEPKLVTPGEDIIYTTQYHNKGKDIAEDVAITNPVPEHMTYIDGTAQGSNNITYSVNGGKNFADASKLTVTDKEGKQRPASAKDYTHIRWLLETLTPDTSGHVSFKAKLN